MKWHILQLFDSGQLCSKSWWLGQSLQLQGDFDFHPNVSWLPNASTHGKMRGKLDCRKRKLKKVKVSGTRSRLFLKPTYSASVTWAKHGSQSLTSNSKPIFGRGERCVEHLSQTALPQARQWCCRWPKVFDSIIARKFQKKGFLHDSHTSNSFQSGVCKSRRYYSITTFVLSDLFHRKNSNSPLCAGSSYSMQLTAHPHRQKVAD